MYTHYWWNINVTKFDPPPSGRVWTLTYFGEKVRRLNVTIKSQIWPPLQVLLTVKYIYDKPKVQTNWAPILKFFVRIGCIDCMMWRIWLIWLHICVMLVTSAHTNSSMSSHEFHMVYAKLNHLFIRQRITNSKCHTKSGLVLKLYTFIKSFDLRCLCWLIGLRQSLDIRYDYFRCTIL